MPKAMLLSNIYALFSFILGPAPASKPGHGLNPPLSCLLAGRSSFSFLEREGCG